MRYIYLLGIVIILQSTILAQCYNPSLTKIAHGFELAEGPLWHQDGYLYFSDVDGNKIYKWTEKDSSLEIYLNPSNAANGLAFDQDSNLVIAQRDLRQITKIDKDGNTVVLADSFANTKLNQPNDLVIRRDGSVLFTTPSFRGSYSYLGYDGFFILTENGDMQLLDKLEGCNGITLSPDETKVYVSESVNNQIFVWDLQEDYTVTNKQLFATLPAGCCADGMKTDLDGNLYVIGPEYLFIYKPSGELLTLVDVPGHPTNINWKNRAAGTAFITTLSSVYELKQPAFLGQIEDVEFNPPYTAPGDTPINIKTKINNPYSGQLYVAAFISSDDSTFADSLLLYDDGSHSDGSAGDNLFGNVLIPPTFESDFLVDIQITDNNSNGICTNNYRSRFTTRGPVVIDTVYASGNDTIANPQDRISYELFLRNEGITDTISSLSVELISLSPYARRFGFGGLPAYDFIAPGEVKQGNRTFRIEFADSCPAPVDLDFALKIISETDTFWTDTFSVHVEEITVGIDEDLSGKPLRFNLSTNYPNPFNPSTTIKYQIPEASQVALTVYDVHGREVKTLVDSRQTAGEYAISFNAANLPSGVYFYQLTTSSGLSHTRKMLLVK